MKIEELKAGRISIDGTDKILAIFDLVPETKSEVKADCAHHIHVLDRSGSMWNHIDDLMEDVKKTLDMCDEEDYITVLWFSGPGEFRTVLKGVKVKEKESICKILDSLKSTVGCTCFSDPIKELGTIIEETLPMCSVYNVTIFTDGDTVTPWSVEEEYRRIFQNLDEIHDKIVAFNAIGYGNYYNRDLLLKMTKTTEYGQLAHASKIDEYHSIFAHNKEIIENIAGKRFNLYTGGTSDIVGLTSKTVKYGKDSITTRLAKARNTFAVFADIGDQRLSVFANDTFPLIIINGFNARLDVKDKVVQDAMYAYAYKLFEEGKRQESLQILNALGDVIAMDKQVNVFTLEEIGQHCKYLQKLVFEERMRNALAVEPNTYAIKGDGYCIFELIQDLVEAGAKYKPEEDYHKITKTRKDTFNLFESNGEEFADMNDVVLSQDRLNISVRFRIDGKVKLNPKRAKSVGLPTEVPACIFRNHALIQDGGLNIKKMTVLLPALATNPVKRLQKYLKSEVSDAIIDNAPELIGGMVQVTLDLTKLPVINATYLEKATADNFLDIEDKMLEIEAQNKIINSKLSEEDVFIGTGKTDYTSEQIAVLVEHGMRQPGVYSALATEAQEPTDFLVIKELKTMLKGFSSLPSIAAMEKKLASGKAMTPGEKLLNKYAESLKDATQDELKALKEANKQSLLDLRFKLSAMKLAVVLTGGWISGLTSQGDNSFTYTKGDKTLVVKPGRKEIAI